MLIYNYNNQTARWNEMSLPGYDPLDFENDEIDESKLEPATDKEIREAIEQVLDEMDEELKDRKSTRLNSSH